MYYLELIQRFWDFNQKNRIGSTGISMYLYLLKNGYDKNSYDVRISDVAAGRELGLTRKTVKTTKEKLKNYGLIEFETKNGLSCCYRLLLDYPLQTVESEKIEKIEKIEIENNSVTIMFENEEVRSPQQLLPTITNNKDIPSLEEFIEYAQTLDSYDAVLEILIKEKYVLWIANGWKNNSDRPITNWKSSLKNIVPYMKNDNDEHQFSISAIPSIKRPKNWDKK